MFVKKWLIEFQMVTKTYLPTYLWDISDSSDNSDSSDSCDNSDSSDQGMTGSQPSPKVPV